MVRTKYRHEARKGYLASRVYFKKTQNFHLQPTRAIVGDKIGGSVEGTTIGEALDTLVTGSDNSVFF